MNRKPLVEEHTTESESDTIALARRFAGMLKRGDVVALHGELGTGKTRFVKGICAAFGADDHVSSPSFVILNRYEGRDHTRKPLYFYHLDLYRVQSIEEIYDLGYEEFAYAENITLIEWSEHLGNLMPAKRFDVRLSYGDEIDQRRISIQWVEEPTRSGVSGKAVSRA